MSDKRNVILFSVFDENKSWYLTENIQRFLPSGVQPQDPEFQVSNVMHSKWSSIWVQSVMDKGKLKLPNRCAVNALLYLPHKSHISLKLLYMSMYNFI